MTPEGFEPAIPPSEPPQPHSLDRPAIWIGVLKYRNKTHGRAHSDGYEYFGVSKSLTLCPSGSVALCVAVCQCEGYQNVTW
jgi:hypothetical protein